MKVTINQMKGIDLYYFSENSPFKNLRYGQAFLNYCLPEITDNELFYEDDTNKSKVIIWLKYVE